MPVRDEVLQHFTERHHLRHQLLRRRVRYQRQHDHAERRLHRRVLVQLIQHHARNRVAFQLDDDARLIRGFVAKIGDPLELLVPNEIRDRLDEVRAVHLVRNLGDDDLRLVRCLAFLDDGARPHDDAPAAGFLIILDPLPPVDVGPRGKVGPFYHLAELRDSRFRVVDKKKNGADDLAQIVRRDVRRHSHGNA